MWEKIRVIFTIPELRQKILLTLLFLAIYRVGSHIPLPIFDQDKMASGTQRSGGGGIGDLLNQASRLQRQHTRARRPIFGLGIMPYISASIIFQLLASVYPPLEKLQKEGESGRKKINEYTRYATVLLCLGQSWGYVACLRPHNNCVNPGFLRCGDPGHRYLHLQLATDVAVLTMTAGTIFLMWLGEQIDEYGIGNGISLLIMAGILARLPQRQLRSCSQPMIAGGGLELGGRADGRGKAPGADRALRRRDGRRGVHQPGAAAHPHAKRQARPRPPRLRRHAASTCPCGSTRPASCPSSSPAACCCSPCCFSVGWPTAFPAPPLCATSGEFVPSRRVLHLQPPLRRS